MSVQHLVAHSPIGFVVAFGAGMASFLSPCVLPLVPSYLSLMSGLSAAELNAATAARPRLGADGDLAAVGSGAATSGDSGTTTTKVAAGDLATAAGGGSGTTTTKVAAGDLATAAGGGSGDLATAAGGGAGGTATREAAVRAAPAVAGAGATRDRGVVDRDQRALLVAALLFVAGFTVVFAAFEAGASALGMTLRRHQTGLTEVAGVAIILMGLVFAGLVRPAWLLRERRVHVLPSHLGSWAAPIMGMAFAFGWTPCIGPTLAAVLALSDTQSTLGRGELMLLSYSLGLGVPFIAAGLAFGRMASVLAWFKAHLRVVNLVSGLLLALLGVLLLTDTFHVLSGWFINLPGLKHFDL